MPSRISPASTSQRESQADRVNVPEIVLLPVNQHDRNLVPVLSVKRGVVVDAQFNEIPFAGLVTKFFKNGRDH